MSIAKSTSASKSVTITFKNAFGNAPILMTSVRNSQCDGSQFVSVIQSVTASGATVLIQRIDSNNGWNGNVFLDYFAFDATSANDNELFIYGETSVTLSARREDVTNLTIALDDKNNNFVVNEPIILLSIQQTTPTGTQYYYGTTTYMNNNVSFGLNFYPINPSGTVQLSIKYIAFERFTLFSNVTADINIKNTMITGSLMDEVKDNILCRL